MGLDYRTTKLLAQHILKPFQPQSCVCLGRPHYLGVDKETSRLCQEFHISPKSDLFTGDYRRRYADAILHAFGIKKLDHLDIFPEEGATIVHDLNLPVNGDLKNRFDLVLDNGTIEHIFNIPQALENCAYLCNVGGHVVMLGPANNFCGHGFFQFSPELFYRTFCESNGFSESKVLLLDYGISGRNIQVVDPAKKKERLEFINASQVMMLGIARKKQHKEPFWTQWPQQSDYVIYWQSPESRAKLVHYASKIEVLLLNKFPKLSRMLQGIKFSALNPKWKLKSNV